MTFLPGPAMRPQVGGFYNLRAGLQCYVEAAVDLYGLTYWRGYILPPSFGVVLWYPGGCYSPTGQHHELDIMAETPIDEPGN